MYLEKIESSETGNKFYLRETPGLLLFFDASASTDPLVSALAGLPVQGLHAAANGRVFAAIGGRLIEIYSDGSGIFRGYLESSTLITEVRHFRFSDNATMLGIIMDYTETPSSLGNGYGLASLKFSDNSFHSVTYNRPGFLGSKWIGFMDQYFITVVADNTTFDLTTQFQISPLNVQPEQAWSASDVFGVESNPDNINGMIINGREAWFFGPGSYEVWFDSGDSVRPFQRIRDAAYAIGLAAPNSLQAFQGHVFWVGSSKEGFGIVWMSQGYQAVRVSNTAIERLIKATGTFDDAIGWTYQIAGHSCYVISFPTAKVTYAYDMSTDNWHELSYRDPSTGEIMQHRGNNQLFAFGKNLVGDFENGLIYELAEDVYTDNLAPIIRYRRCPVLGKGLRTIFYDRLEIEVQSGVGLDTGSDPQMSIRWSNDNGYTWGNYHTRPLGKLGKYATRVIVNQMGSSKQRVYEFYTSDPVPFRILSAELRLDIGDT